MIRLVILLQALALSSSELSKNKVDQTPTALIKRPGETVLLSCNHSNPSFDMIQWYKQSAEGQDLVLLAFVRFSYRDVEDQFEDLYNVSGTGGSQSSLHILKLNGSEERAVYFCAASDAQRCRNPQP
ncbi:hypothetical protein FQN60_008586 [Xyrichtys novacula]|uniref:Ig-like domain-containing protein n=1 Tax=Xyrichtys novacula TaxID=13765 RepID=A0AAV1GNS4_XYRNO|nr:hypothetical protein FQN60_008586 [Xyrichtys novacula]